MVVLHELTALAVVGLALATLAASVIGGGVGTPARLWLDRLILAALLGLLAAAATGLPLLFLVGPPADPLHLLYGFAAPLILLGGRYLGRDRSIRQRSLLMVVASLALLGVIFRLFTTAG